MTAKTKTAQDAPTTAQDAPTTTARPGVRVSARQAALVIGAAIGADVTPKMVRTVARDTMTRFQDDAYTPHQYDATEVRALLGAFRERGTRRAASIAGSGPDGRVVAADVAALLGIELDEQGSPDAS